MRTLTATRSTAEEAEAVRQRLEAAGVAPERIAFRQLTPAAGDSAEAGGGIFISAKVMPEQVASATEILREPEPPAPTDDSGDDDEALPPATAEVAIDDRIEPASPDERSADRVPEDDQTARLMKAALRLMLLVALAALVGFVGGYLLGQLIN